MICCLAIGFGSSLPSKLFKFYCSFSRDSIVLCSLFSASQSWTPSFCSKRPFYKFFHDVSKQFEQMSFHNPCKDEDLA
jgi:hypothetical protein